MGGIESQTSHPAFSEALMLPAAFLRHVREKEKAQGIEPDPTLNAFTKGQLVHGRKETLST